MKAASLADGSVVPLEGGSGAPQDSVEPEPPVPMDPPGEPAPAAAPETSAPETSVPETSAPKTSVPGARDATTGEVAFTLLRAQFDLMRAHEPAVERADDGEALHELRVDIRRLRAALGLFADALPVRASAYRDRLGEFGGVLGAVRDLDVQATRVAGWAAATTPAERDTLETLADVLDDRRRQARRRAVAALSSRSARRSFESLDRFIDRGPPRRSSIARMPVIEMAPELLAQEHRKTISIGDRVGPDASAEALHALRIRCKRLRYGVEFFEPWYGKAARTYVKRVVDVQDLLGDHQDAVVGAAALHEIGLDPSRPLPAAKLLTLGALAERLRAEARAAHRLLPKRYQTINGKRWRRLVRVMENSRED